MKKKPIILALAAALFASPLCASKKTPISKPPRINFAKLSDHEKSHYLDWVIDPHANTICEGYYLAPPINYPGDLSKGIDKAQAFLSAKDGSFSLTGQSALTNQVELLEPYKKITADLAYETPNAKTHHPQVIDLYGHVKLYTPDLLVVANHAHVDLPKKSLSVDDGLYRYVLHNTAKMKEDIGRYHKTLHIQQLNAWGHAEDIRKVGPEQWAMQNVSYTTCPVNHPAWRVSTQSLYLDRHRGWGKAKDAWLKIRGIPIFYTPYITFPIDARRKTGILIPRMGHSSRSGTEVAFPFYWNIAPDYDMTITPHWLQQRGLLISDEFRYLQPDNNGKLEVSLIPYDRKFARFQKTAQNDYTNNVLLPNLENASPRRFGVSWKNTFRLAPYLQSDIDYNYVSDNYYLYDLGQRGLTAPTPSQLLQKGEIDFISPHWQLSGLVQGYQTLNQVFQEVDNQYQRLPSLSLHMNYPKSILGFDYFIDANATNFFKGQEEWQENPPVIGKRMNIQPGIALRLSRPYGFISPRFHFDITKYYLRRQNRAYFQQPSRITPISSLHAGLFFNRNFRFANIDFAQTLEPQLFYLYVPKRNKQEVLPLFDTVRQAFTYEQLFAENRFSSVDRIGDANQLSVAMNTRLINRQNGEEEMNAGLGTILYFRHRQVRLDPDAASSAALAYDRRPLSPLVGEFNIHLPQRWTLRANAAWNLQLHKFDNHDFAITYHHGDNQVLTTGYSYIRDVTPFEQAETTNKLNALRSYYVTGVWKFTPKFALLGRLNTNIAPLSGHSYWAGFAYNSCCFGIEAVYYRSFTGIMNLQHRNYNTGFYLQFTLKGFGAIGNGNASSLLASKITGYHSMISGA